MVEESKQGSGGIRSVVWNQFTMLLSHSWIRGWEPRGRSGCTIGLWGGEERGRWERPLRRLNGQASELEVVGEVAD